MRFDGLGLQKTGFLEKRKGGTRFCVQGRGEGVGWFGAGTYIVACDNTQNEVPDPTCPTLFPSGPCAILMYLVVTPVHSLYAQTADYTPSHSTVSPVAKLTSER